MQKHAKNFVKTFILVLLMLIPFKVFKGNSIASDTKISDIKEEINVDLEKSGKLTFQFSHKMNIYEKLNHQIDSVRCQKIRVESEKETPSSLTEISRPKKVKEITDIKSTKEFIENSQCIKITPSSDIFKDVIVPDDYYIMDFNDEIKSLAFTMNAEQGQSLVDCWYVGQIVLNRLHDTLAYKSRNYKNILDVLYDSKQFSVNPYFTNGVRKKPGKTWKLDKDDERCKTIYKIAWLCYHDIIPDNLRLNKHTLYFFMPNACDRAFTSSFDKELLVKKSEANGTWYCKHRFYR